MNREEGMMAPPENVISSAVEVVSFSESLHDQSDDKRVTNMSSNTKADEKIISHHDPSPKNSSMSEVGVAAKRILEAVPGYTSSDWMQKHNDLSVRQPHIDPIQTYSTFAIPPSFEYSTSLSYPYAYRQYLPDTTPPIFQNTPLRRGKWTIEEETYANAIIEAFEKGALQGCENGCTLRAYLSRKLHCQPMRISKKYAGKSIGKQVFLSRLNAPPGRRILCSDSTEKLKHLEFQFHMSLVQESSSASGTQPIYGNGNGLTPFSLERHPDMHQQLRGFDNSTKNNSNVASLSGLDPKCFPSSNSNQSVGHINSNPANKQILNNLQMVAESFSNASKMHMDLYNALKQAQSSYFASIMPPDTESKMDDQTAALESANANLSISKPIESNDDLIKNLNSGQAQENWINETMALIPSLDPTKHDTGRSTPTYTSKSFDDLHQFIGKGLPVCESENDKNSRSKFTPEKLIGPASKAANNLMRDLSQTTLIHHPMANFAEGLNLNSAGGYVPTNFISDADEYAYFAKQSAIEASKHSAYHLPPMTNFPMTSSSTNQEATQNIIQNSTLNSDLHQNEPMTFRNINMNHIGKPRQQKERMTETHRVSPLSGESSFLMNSHIVSGSERSSSDFGTEHSSSSRINVSGVTSSDDTCSDDTSDEGNMAKQHLVANNKNGKRSVENAETQMNRKKMMKCQ